MRKISTIGCMAACLLSVIGIVFALPTITIQAARINQRLEETGGPVSRLRNVPAPIVQEISEEMDESTKAVCQKAYQTSIATRRTLSEMKKNLAAAESALSAAREAAMVADKTLSEVSNTLEAIKPPFNGRS